MFASHFRQRIPQVGYLLCLLLINSTSGNFSHTPGVIESRGKRRLPGEWGTPLQSRRATTDDFHGRHYHKTSTGRDAIKITLQYLTSWGLMLRRLGFYGSQLRDFIQQ